MDFFKVLAVISLVSSWMKKALKDGKITLVEALDLIGQLAPELGLPLDFDIADVLGKPPDEAATPLPEGVAAEDDETDFIKP